MITIILNNQPVQINASRLHTFLENTFESSLRMVCAVAVNQRFVPREQHHQIILRENDVIDLIVPMQGG